MRHAICVTKSGQAVIRHVHLQMHLAVIVIIIVIIIITITIIIISILKQQTGGKYI